MTRSGSFLSLEGSHQRAILARIGSFSETLS
jgi:hypothetical protein